MLSLCRSADVIDDGSAGDDIEQGETRGFIIPLTRRHVGDNHLLERTLQRKPAAYYGEWLVSEGWWEVE